MKSDLSRTLAASVLVGLFSLTLAQGGSLTDYGSTPAITQPQGNQSAANQKLDFHTDLFTGRFGYQIPVETPPARGGTEPEVALEYNSANKNSWCGVGWDLDFGYIQRETRYGIPIPIGGSAYSDAYGFTFSFGGHSGRLISNGGGVYFPQINTDHLKFVYTSGWWIVTDKSGQTYYFGETTAARIANTLGTFKWGLSSVHDPNGNLTSVSYSADDGQMYLKEIDYNGNTNSPGIATNCAIAFDLESTARADISSSEISGSEIITEKRLQNIRVLDQGQLVRRYALAYTISPSTGRSLLHTVTEYGSDNTTALPVHTFTYTVQVDEYESTVAWPIDSQGTTVSTDYGIDPANSEAALMDINGDGLPDRVYQPDYNSPFDFYYMQLNNGNGFNSPVAWSPLTEEDGSGTMQFNDVDSSSANSLWSQSVSSLIDMNGDGLPDRVVRQHDLNGSGVYDHLQVQLNNGSGFNTRTSWTGLNSADASFAGGVMNDAYAKTGDGEGDLATMIDMNGDGLPDRVMEGSASGRFDVQINLNSSFSSRVAWGNVTADGTYAYTPRCRDYSHVYSELMDMNGDGLPDRVLQSGIQLNNGHGFDSYQTTWNYGGDPETVNVTDGNYTTQWIDMNGDGLPDYVVSSGTGTYTVYFNTGRGFSSTGVTWSNVNTSGDGTTGWNNLQSWNAAGSKVMFMDMNGDGLLDRVTRSYISGDVDLFVQLSPGPFPDLMNSVANGIGGSVSVTYQPSTIYRNPDSSSQRMTFPVNVVSSVTVSDGRGNVGTNNYAYSGGYYDPAYREFRGFYEAQQTDPLGTITQTFFHQGADGSWNGSASGEYQDDVAKAGMVFATQTIGSDGKLYNQTFDKVNEFLLYNGGSGITSDYFPFIQQTFRLDYEGNTGYRASAVGYAYDGTGNLLGKTNLSEVAAVNVSNYTFTAGVSGAPPPVYEQYTYATIPSNTNIIDHVASDTVCADAAGTVVLQQTLYQYFDVTGNLKQKSELICPGTYAENSYTYDNYGNVATTTNPIGIVQTITYDAAATFPTRKYTGTLADNLIEYTQYDPRSGAILNATNEEGLVTANAYDVFLRLTNSATSTTPNGAPTLVRKQLRYGLGGIVSNNSSNYVRLLENDPANSSTGYHETDTYLDGLGRPIQSRAQAETGQYRVSDLVYNARGSVILEEYPQFQAGASYSKPASTRTNIYTQYDPIGRPFKINPNASASFNSSGWLSGTPTVLSGDTGSPVGSTSFAYKDGTNSWAIIVTNALGKIHKYYQDAYGRTNEIIEVTSGGNFTTTLAYDLLGQLTNITDNAGNKISFYFDDVGNRVAMADPDMGFWQWGYDLAGNLTLQTDAKGQQIKFYYTDPAGRLTRREGYNAAGQLVSTNLYLYDSNGGDSAYTVYPGQLFEVMDDEGWQKSSYDVRDRTLKSVRYLSKNGNTYTNQSTYDDADRISTTTYPNGGPTITNIFDTGENLSQVKQVGGANTVYYAAKGFNALDQLLGVNFGNGVQTTNIFYPVSLRLQKIVTSKSANLQSLTYTFDALGNVKGIADGVYSGLASASFGNISYDDLNRLTALTNASGSYAYSFDSVGNFNVNGESGGGSYVYGTIRPHAVKSANGAWFTYDQDGNIVFRTGQRLDYDVNNHLYRFIGTNGVTTFGYAADGSRLWEQSGTNSLQVWIGNNYEEKQGLTLYHIYAGSRLVATFDETITNLFQYYHPDDLTSTSIQTDTNGSVVQNFEYSAFGQSRYTQNTNAIKVSRRFTSQILDEATGLYYYNARYYIPELGRFGQPDDIIPDLSDPQSYNRYAYCVNNPLRYTDPSGHWGQEVADAWPGEVNSVFESTTAGSESTFYIGTMGTLNSLVGGIAEPLRLGSSAGTVSGNPNATAGQIALAGVQEAARAASLIPVGAAIGKGAGTLLGAGEKEAAGQIASQAGKGLTDSQTQRIQNFADKHNTQVNIVGSRAAGKAGESSDFDYVIGGKSKTRQAARRELPRGKAGGEITPSGHETGIDVFNANKTPLDTSRPHATFDPKPKQTSSQ